MVRMLVGLLVVAVHAPPAYADEERDDDVPAFVTLDRVDRHTRVGAELSYVTHDDPRAFLSAHRVELFGQFVRRDGWGVYASLPISRSSEESRGVYESFDATQARGNAEVSLVFANPRGTYALRGGLVVPTVGEWLKSDRNGDDSTLFTRSIAGAGRAADASLVHDQPSLRFSASRFMRRGPWYGRIDGGVDIRLGVVQYSYRYIDNKYSLVVARFNAAVGVDLGMLAVGIEGAASTMDRIAMTAALSVRIRDREAPIEPYVATGVAYNIDVRPGLFVTAGVQFVP